MGKRVCDPFLNRLHYLRRMYAAGYQEGYLRSNIQSIPVGLLILKLEHDLYAFIADSQSGLFLATVLPGIILVILLSTTNWWSLAEKQRDPPHLTKLTRDV